jgi:Protein of unknown function (DUF1688)
LTTTETRSEPIAPEGVGARGARSLLSARAVRTASQRLLELALSGGLEHWTIDLDRLPATADFVAGVIKERYPSLKVPVHSRWRHFVLEGRDLWAGVTQDARWSSTEAKARAAFDLVITSVLLDAGAGAAWRFRDSAQSGLVVARSEGLALASLRWFATGALSDTATTPYRVDAAALLRVDEPSVARAFQVSEANPLAGLRGRADLLNRLGAAVESRPELFAMKDSPRPGGLFDLLCARARDGRLPAATILETLLDALGSIWEGRPHLSGVSLGDCWPHPALKGPRPEDGYAPLHKLSQWLTYSLIEPMTDAGITVCDLDELTGLAEYRNGGLFIDMGVLAPREASALLKVHAVADPFVVGWRSLTVALLDLLAPMVGSRLGLEPDLFPLARMLEGGTWAAGRIVARDKRPDGGPPFNVLSDGTVF